MQVIEWSECLIWPGSAEFFYESLTEGDVKARGREQGKQQTSRLRFFTSDLHGSLALQLCPVMAHRVHTDVKQNWAPTQTAFTLLFVHKALPPGSVEPT